MPSSPDWEGVGRVLRTPAVRIGAQFVVWCVALAALAGTVGASNGLTLSKSPKDTLAVPRWLYLATGGATIGASALLASFVTDRAFIARLDDWSYPLPSAGRLRRLAVWGGLTLGVVVLVLAVYLGFTGPALPTASFTILIAFAGGRAALPILSYVVGNVWPILNPWRAIATVLPSGFVTYPASLQRWPAVCGLLALVWVEVVFPISTVPSVLATVLVVYSVVTVAGAVLVGPEAWFHNADPVSVMLRCYGAVGIVQRYPDRVRAVLPGSRLQDPDVVTDRSDIAFVIGLVWELTYSGFITTTAGDTTIRTLTAVLPAGSTTNRAIVVYTAVFLAGYAVFLGAYLYAGRWSRRLSGTYLTSRALAVRFAPPLLAVAAGYHLAHYATLAVSLAPAMVAVSASPLVPPPNPVVLSPPGWFNAASIAFVLAGHLLAVWAAHTAAYDVFPRRLVAIKSQYPFVLVMIGYTVVSLWLLSLQGAVPPFVG
ncbi:hypothetical protein KI372_11525 [Halobacterium salinarum]|nr:hypothetical protein [Halobacterium salinarum]